MIPRELKLDANGHDRIGRIEEADRALAIASIMAEAYASDPDRGFDEFAGDECESGSSRRECGINLYLSRLDSAANLYAAAGLGLLSRRVRAICKAPPEKAWRKFQSINSRTEF
jgi:hypothetical protein